MKLTNKIAGIVALCAGLVQVTSPNLVKVDLVKEVPGMKLEYYVEQAQRKKAKDIGESPWKDMKKDTVRIGYHDEDPVEILHVRKSGETVEDRPLTLLKLAQQNDKQHEIIVINEAGFPRYSSKEDFEKIKKTKADAKAKDKEKTKQQATKSKL